MQWVLFKLSALPMLNRCFRVWPAPATSYPNSQSHASSRNTPSHLSSSQQLSMRDRYYRQCVGHCECDIGDLCNPSSFRHSLLASKGHRKTPLQSRVHKPLHCLTYLTRNERRLQQLPTPISRLGNVQTSTSTTWILRLTDWSPC